MINNDTQDISKTEYGILSLVLSSASPSEGSCECRRVIDKGMNNEVPFTWVTKFVFNCVFTWICVYT